MKLTGLFDVRDGGDTSRFRIDESLGPLTLSQGRFAEDQQAGMADENFVHVFEGTA